MRYRYKYIQILDIIDTRYWIFDISVELLDICIAAPDGVLAQAGLVDKHLRKSRDCQTTVLCCFVFALLKEEVLRQRA